MLYVRILIRHIIGYGLLLPVVIVGIFVQALILGPIFKNRTTIPRWIYQAIARLFGIRHAFNAQSVEMVTDGPVMFLCNHLSRVDFVILRAFHDPAPMMNAGFFVMPVFGPLIRLFAYSVGIIGTKQSQDSKAEDLGQLAGLLGNGRNAFLFPEGIQTDGRRLLRYSRGPAEIFFDPAYTGEYPQLAKAKVQPVVLRLRSINGREVLNSPEDWADYTIARGRTNIFHGMYRASRTAGTTLDLLLLPPLDPGEFQSPEALMEAAHSATLPYIAPSQTKIVTREEWRSRMDVGDFSL